MVYGLITGQLGYSLRREFLGNAINFRNVEEFNFTIYSTDFVTLSAAVIQSGVQSQFQNFYSGEITVTAFATKNQFSYPSDSIRASAFDVTVSIKDSIPNINIQQPELLSSYYYGLDGTFFGTYGQYLLNFQENFNFATNEQGNRIFNHEVSFSLQTGWAGDNSTNGRKSFAQNIANAIFIQDDNLSFGITTMIGQITGIANTSLYRNYYNESYDLYKNTYTFSRRREELPLDQSNTVFNLNYSINMGENGIIDVIEKVSTTAYISYPIAINNLNSFLTGAYARCSGKYGQFYNDSIIMQDSQYQGLVPTLPLINTPVRTIKNYNPFALDANYEVTFTNNPQFSGDGTITSQTIEFNIGEYNQVEATHSFDYTVNRIIQDSGYSVTGLLANTTGSTQSTMLNYYTGNFGDIYNIYPNFNLIKYNVNYPNIQTKSSAKFTYSNNPTYFLTVNGVTFPILDYTVDNKNPEDIILEYKIVNPPQNMSILSYQYQSEKGEIAIGIKANLGKNSNQFFPDAVGSFSDLNNLNIGEQPLIYYLTPLYMFAGQIFLQQFNYPIENLNWFLSDSKYSFNSDGILEVNASYSYTVKKRNFSNNP